MSIHGMLVVGVVSFNEVHIIQVGLQVTMPANLFKHR